MSICYVYLIQAGAKRNSPVKIGMSDNYKKRMKTLQTGNHERLRLLCAISCDSRKHAKVVESTLHEILQTQNILGEWFKIRRSNFFKALNSLANNSDIDCISAFDGAFEEKNYNAVSKLEKKNKNLVNNNKEMIIKLQSEKAKSKALRERIEELENALRI